MAYFTAKPTVSKQPKAGVVFNALKHDIMLGLVAAGTVLTELELAAHFQCSQGTVREALLQLQEEGLVRRQGHRGTQVSECTQDEAVEMFRLRTQIECSGLPRAMMSAGKVALLADLNSLFEDMLAAADADDELQLASIDRDFHRRILDAANLPALEPILHRCLVHNHRFKISKNRSLRDLHATALRHRNIIEAIEQNDVSGATERMRAHIATIVDFGPAVFPDMQP